MNNASTKHASGGRVGLNAINCQFHTRIGTDKQRRGRCSLGMYGGFVTFGVCKMCIDRNQNNEEYAKELFAKVERTHPSNHARISGCCDSAMNYIE